MLLLLMLGFCMFKIGYHWPRDVELESTKPVIFKYEITKDAAKLLILKSTEGLEYYK